MTGGGTIAFLNTKNGNVWVGRSSDLNSVNPATSDPSMRLGTGGKIAVTHDGTVYGYRPSDGTVLTMQDPTGKAVQGGSSPKGRPYPPTISPWWTAPRSSHPRADCTGTRAAPTPAPTAR